MTEHNSILAKIARQAIRQDKQTANQVRLHKDKNRFDLHPLVAKTVDVLRDPDLVWDPDFDFTRLPLADLLSAVGHLAIIEQELVALCEPIVSGDDDWQDGLL